MSTYFGNMTIVLKLPLISAASTKGLHRYRGFCPFVEDGDGGGMESELIEFGKVADVGVGERRGARGPARCIVRLQTYRIHDGTWNRY